MKQLAGFDQQDFKNYPEPVKEKEVQRLVVSYYRKFIKPKFKGSRLIVNSFSDKVMSFRQMNVAKAQGFENGQPDIIIVAKNNKFLGIAIELKVIRSNKVRLNTKHEKEQESFLNDLKSVGFDACFCYGLHHALSKIEEYFSHE